MQVWVLIGLIMVGTFVVIAMYNSLVKLKILVENAWSDVNVYLKKRHDLIPNLVSTVKGYATHEKETLDAVIQARNNAHNAQNTQAQVDQENIISTMLPKIFALSESYPDLKANQNFLELSNELSKLEGQIGESRRYYNAVVRDFNTKQQVFPSNLIAGAFNFKIATFFEVVQSEKEVPNVKF